MRKRSETTRAVIIAAAKELFLSQGYVVTTVEAIAERANMTKRTIYGYFPDKRSLFKGVIEQSVGDPWEFHIPLEGIATVKGVRNALFAISQGIEEIITQPDYVQLLRVTIAEIPTQPDLSILFERGATRRSYRAVAGLLKTAGMHGVVTFKDSDVAAQQFVGGFVMRVFLDGLLHAKPVVTRQTNQQLADYVDDFLGRLISSGQEAG
ncbi:MAG TPA: TetR/AcrR family transcriptional regulator [Candidatus Saccharimonadales bacterium]